MLTRFSPFADRLALWNASLVRVISFHSVINDVSTCLTGTRDLSLVRLSHDLFALPHPRGTDPTSFTSFLIQISFQKKILPHTGLLQWHLSHL